MDADRSGTISATELHEYITAEELKRRLRLAAFHTDWPSLCAPLCQSGFARHPHIRVAVAGTAVRADDDCRGRRIATAAAMPRNRFAHFDVDGNGELDFDEFVAAIRASEQSSLVSMNSLTDEDLAELFAKVDVDRCLSLRFSAAILPKPDTFGCGAAGAPSDGPAPTQPHPLCAFAPLGAT